MSQIKGGGGFQNLGCKTLYLFDTSPKAPKNWKFLAWEEDKLRVEKNVTFEREERLELGSWEMLKEVEGNFSIKLDLSKAKFKCTIQLYLSEIKCRWPVKLYLSQIRFKATRAKVFPILCSGPPPNQIMDCITLHPTDQPQLGGNPQSILANFGRPTSKYTRPLKNRFIAPGLIFCLWN